ncbi:NAD-dependent epimerase/dehydratase family protein [Phytoactinopolyspora mesophila]|uniref:NAD-dependent epimerase/dehydratase family protein n=1 Tax=Phytoactinopolyspora mesophila TaxID=2650750 RepID=A0A7K3MA18_9ACTN|nr:NAD-dependent epimerase/dehydratase family protein [Phytoactinopolyspora mesophila]NDL60134.1 NAD-dependent epimerase/dehydratase family protein [Phytoactinopolyspora mesophila]
MVRTVEELEERLSRPRAALIEDFRRLEGDIVVLGAAGKMGPSLVRLATRAIAEAGTGAKVTAVSRFSQPGSADAMRATGAHVHPADLSDDAAIAGLPAAANVIFLVGAKFGTSGHESATWATNAYLPGRIAQRYPGSNIVALSTGNVYPLTPTGSGGPTEEHPVGPVGEYAMSCLGRERIFTHFAGLTNTPLALIRLNYAAEPRYGVLVDIGLKVRAGEPVDVTTGYANVVWQGYANEVVLRSLLHAGTPPFVLNLTGPETVSVRGAAEQFARAFATDVTFSGSEAPTALLSNASRCHGLFGYPDVPLAELVQLTAGWISDGQSLLGKPTKFDVRDGQF